MIEGIADQVERLRGLMVEAHGGIGRLDEGGVALECLEAPLTRLEMAVGMVGAELDWAIKRAVELVKRVERMGVVHRQAQDAGAMEESSEMEEERCIANRC